MVSKRVRKTFKCCYTEMELEGELKWIVIEFGVLATWLVSIVQHRLGAQSGVYKTVGKYQVGN